VRRPLSRYPRPAIPVIWQTSASRELLQCSDGLI
jgi:hypothetical protein